MLCQECGKRPATVHLTKIMQDQVEQLHLCGQCAREKGEFNFFADPAQLLQNLLANFAGMETVKPQVVPHCPTCGFSLERFQQTGRLGCPACYTHFASQLEPLLRRLHGTPEHRGKLPKRRGSSYRLSREKQDLQAALQRAVAQEEYEEAARLRDRIRAIGEGGGAST